LRLRLRLQLQLQLQRAGCHQPPHSPPTPQDDPAVFISQAFAQTAPAAAASGGMESTLLSLLPLVLMFVVLYFIMIRPQMKKQKEHKAMIDAIAKGEEIVIAGGVLGRVSKVGDSYLQVEVANGVELQVQRAAVIQVLPKGTFGAK
jgi:preprotein translocase subunit YajC